jgi:hypothetical protein
MSGPANATLNGDGFRFYQWQDAGSEDVYNLLSVTSIRKLCGENFGLVNWQLNNVIDTVMGTVKRPKPGKRVAFLKNQFIYVPEAVPSEFIGKYLTAAVDDTLSVEQAAVLRKWLRETADEPRNIAARRGTIVHAAIEKNIAWDRIERPWVEAEFNSLSAKDRAAAPGGVKDEDIEFVRDAVRQYFDMRATVPFVIIAREPQVFNLTLGYGGSADTIIWFLPEGVDIRSVPKAHLITLNDVARIGGFLAVGDWKTSKGVFTDHVVQVHAYGAGEFVGADGLRNHRLTELLQATTKGVIVHIRPTGWGVHVFPFTEEVFHGFEGSVAFARLLAKYPRASALFEENYTGGFTDLDEEEE